MGERPQQRKRDRASRFSAVGVEKDKIRDGSVAAEVIVETVAGGKVVIDRAEVEANVPDEFLEEAPGGWKESRESRDTRKAEERTAENGSLERERELADNVEAQREQRAFSSCLWSSKLSHLCAHCQVVNDNLCPLNRHGSVRANRAHEEEGL